MKKWSLLFVAVLQLQLLIVGGQQTKGVDEVSSERRILNASTIDETPERIREIEQFRLGRRSNSCRRIKQRDPNAPSKMYTITVASPLFVYATSKTIDVYCEMGLNGGGYTFLTPESVLQLHPSDLLSLFTDRTSFLLRVRKTDGTQPYAVLNQLPQYAHVPLKLNLSDWSDYQIPFNAQGQYLNTPYVYFGFMPYAYPANNNVQGLLVNGFNNNFTNGESTFNGQFTLFPNFLELNPSAYDVPSAFCDRIFANLLPIPSGRVMPPEIYMFGETHWGGTCFKQTNTIPGVLSFAIGFR